MNNDKFDKRIPSKFVVVVPLVALVVTVAILLAGRLQEQIYFSKVVATVNHEAITRSDIIKATREAGVVNRQRTCEELISDVVNDLVNAELIYQEYGQRCPGGKTEVIQCAMRHMENNIQQPSVSGGDYILERKVELQAIEAEYRSSVEKLMSSAYVEIDEREVEKTYRSCKQSG